MTVEVRDHRHDGPGGRFLSAIARDAARTDARPGVLVIPNILGPKQMDVDRATNLARLGYVAMVVDLYGEGNRPTRADPDPGRFMNALNADRPHLRDRLHAALAQLAGLDGVDPTRLAAIGYCFGGKAVLDLARSGAPLRAGVSFHGVYDPPGYPVVEPIRTKLLVCHGWDDPLATPAQTLDLAAELTAAGADWQLLAFGHTAHAFTDATAAMPGHAMYHAAADRRSWTAMRDL